MTITPQSTPPGSNSGKAALEYGVIIGLVVITLFALLAIFGPELQARLFPQATQAPNEGPIYQVVEEGVFAEVTGTEVFTLTNCTDSAYLGLPVIKVKEIEHRILLEGDISGATEVRLMGRLTDYYGFTHEETAPITVTVPITLTPGLSVELPVMMQYIWKEGEVVVTEFDGTENRYNYRARTDLDWVPGRETTTPAVCTP